jgi:hydroxymethylpyrimidine/phosphomethylpyrimidine kinase
MNHSPPHYPPSLRPDDVPHWIKLQDAIDQLVSFLPLELVPEVGINFVYALPAATQTKDVLGVSGRIIKQNKKIVQTGELQLGGSRHIASIITTCMRQNPQKRSAMNIAYSPQIVAHAKKKGWKTGSFDRAEEPPNKRTMDWGTETVIQSQGSVPDLIWDAGSPGKEPMIRVISETPQGVLEILKSLTEKY